MVYSKAEMSKTKAQALQIAKILNDDISVIIHEALKSYVEEGFQKVLDSKTEVKETKKSSGASKYNNATTSSSDEFGSEEGESNSESGAY